MRRAASVVVLVAVATGGCGLVSSGTEPGGPPGSDFATPTADATSAEVQPVTEPPRDSREVAGDGFTVYAPTEFQQSDRAGPGDVPMIVLGKASNRSGGVVEVVLFTEAAPPATAQEQMYGLAGSKELAGATDILRQAVEWPGATSAVVVRWTERTATAQGDVVQRFAQLAAQTESGSIVTAVAVAPEDEFDSSGALQVLRTVRLDGA